MTIHNKTKNTTLYKGAKTLTTFLDRSLGLLNPKQVRAVVFSTRFGIHTIGMKLPIDIIILSSEAKVMALKENLKPNSFYLWNPRYATVLELPAGTIKKSKTQIGDTITIE